MSDITTTLDPSTLNSPISISEPLAFPKLDDSDLAALKPLATICSYKDGEVVFRAGDADLDLFVVECGAIDILNPSDGDRLVVTHRPGQFAGDIDLLTRRPVIVTAVARGETRLLRVPGGRLREILNKVPRLSEKLLIAIQERRRLLTGSGVIGLRVVGPGKCRDTMLVREFLYKNFVPFTWYESESEQGQKLMTRWGSPKKSPVIEVGDGKLLINPGLRELAQGAGVWRHCPVDMVDLAIIGAGPAGMTAAVYAASEGVSTVVLDRLGPGGQAAGSSKIENFIGFPSGLSGAELATRSVLQMLKFGRKDGRARHRRKDLRQAKTMTNFTCFNWIAEPSSSTHGSDRCRRALAKARRRGRRAIRIRGDSLRLHDRSKRFSTTRATSPSSARETPPARRRCFWPSVVADRTVHMLVRKRLGPGMSEYLVRRIRATPNISLHEGVEIAAVHGERRLESVTLRAFNPDGASEQQERTLGRRSPSPLRSSSSALSRDVPGCQKSLRATNSAIS